MRKGKKKYADTLKMNLMGSKFQNVERYLQLLRPKTESHEETQERARAFQLLNTTKENIIAYHDKLATCRY